MERLNLNPEIWGGKKWFSLHSFALSYPTNPDNDFKNKVKFMLENQDILLPCEKCRIHYKQNLKKFPITDKVLSNSKELLKWMINIQNEVRKQNNKEEFTFEQVMSYYQNVYAPNNSNNIYIYLIVGSILSFIVWMKFKK